MASVETLATPERLEAARPPSIWRKLLRHRLFMTGATLLLLMVLLAIFADLIEIRPPEKMQVRLRFKTPDFAYPLGTDNYGRDIYSRLVHGARLSLAIGFAVALITGILGTAIGVAAGYFKRLDSPLMRLMDALMAFPAILLAIAIAAALGPSAMNAVIALAVVYTPRTARIVRSTVLVVLIMCRQPRLAGQEIVGLSGGMFYQTAWRR